MGVQMARENKEDQFEVSEKDKRKQRFSQKKNKDKGKDSSKFKLFSKGRQARPSTRDLLDCGEDDDDD